jgi:hypothetical protein
MEGQFIHVNDDTLFEAKTVKNSSSFAMSVHRHSSVFQEGPLIEQGWLLRTRLGGCRNTGTYFMPVS